jgi:ABC-2 type transport system permease protein
LTANFASKAIQLTLGTFSAGAEMKALQKKGMNSEQAKANRTFQSQLYYAF